MKNSKKVWEILEGQENCNAFYIGGKESLLYGTPIDNKAIEVIQSNLAKQESIIAEFDKDGYDIGNVACVYLSGKPLEYALGIRKGSNAIQDLANEEIQRLQDIQAIEKKLYTDKKTLSSMVNTRQVTKQKNNINKKIYLQGKKLYKNKDLYCKQHLQGIANSSDLFDTLSIETQHTSYRKNWVACFDRLGKYKQKNSNSKQKRNGMVVDAFADGIALLQYTEEDYQKSELQIEQIQNVYRLYKEMSGTSGNTKKSYNAKIKKAIKDVASDSIIGLASSSNVVTKRERKKYTLIK